MFIVSGSTTLNGQPKSLTECSRCICRTAATCIFLTDGCGQQLAICLHGPSEQLVAVRMYLTDRIPK